MTELMAWSTHCAARRELSHGGQHSGTMVSAAAT